ncbi:hypothetical protein [Streptomyces griseus]|uniref:hypothetical protein n=1 Tax=Streptomyces griseus TaxID=1911 RepID=UPI0005622552|nr:hypothetical protein [Streptomyces griseus]
MKSGKGFLGRTSPAGEIDSSEGPGGGWMSTKVRAALVGSGFGVVTLAAALTVHATNSPRAAETANTGESRPGTTASASRAVHCGAWQTTNSANVVVRACVQAVDGIGRAFFGAEIENRGKETAHVSVLVKYVVSEKTLDCPGRPGPWTGAVIDPGDSRRTALVECRIDGLRNHTVRTRAWAVTGTGGPLGSRPASSPTLTIEPDGTVIPLRHERT